MKTIRKTMALTTMVLIGMFAQAQEFDFGAKAGPSLALLGGDVDTDMRASLHTGVYGRYMFNDQWGIQAEALYSGKGGTDEDDDNIKYKLHYVSLPVLANYQIFDGFRVELGPQVGILLDSKTDVDNVGEFEIDDSYKTLDFGLAFGANYEMDMGLNFGARYELGLSDIADSNALFGNNSIRNGVFQISVGYTFFKYKK